MLAAFLTIVTLCGDPVWITGMSEDGRVLTGSAEYIYKHADGATLFVDIIDSLPVGSDGEPKVLIKEVGEDHMCPTHSA